MGDETAARNRGRPLPARPCELHVPPADHPRFNLGLAGNAPIDRAGCNNVELIGPAGTWVVSWRRLAPAAACSQSIDCSPPPPRRSVAAPPLPEVDYIPAQVARKSDTGPQLTEAQLAGATAGAGDDQGRGGRRRRALRHGLAAVATLPCASDPGGPAAIADSAGKATLLWNGDWVRTLAARTASEARDHPRGDHAWRSPSAPARQPRKAQPRPRPRRQLLLNGRRRPDPPSPWGREAGGGPTC